MKKRSIGITLSYVYFVLNSVLGLFLSSFLLRKLGDTEYGLYQTISAFVNYLVILEFGVGTVITRNIVSARNKGEDEVRKNITTLFYLTFFLSFLILIIAIIFYFSIEGIYHNTIPAHQMNYAINMFLILVLYLLFSFFSNTLR